MPSPHKAVRFGAALLMLIGVLAARPTAQRQPAGVPVAREEVAAALAEVKRDPNLGGQNTMKMLRWKAGEQQKKADLSWFRWVAGFFGWIGQSARYLIWLTIALLVGWLGVYLVRAIRSQAEQAAASADKFVPPTHVRNLDIRPQSLPSNIGAAARSLWEKGDHRAALSLLYRGLLSRLSHVHRVPIIDSSTEGDCLLLLPGRVPPKTSDYAAQLVDAWRGFVYGGTEAATPTVFALCDGFAAALDRAATRPTQGGAQ